MSQTCVCKHARSSHNFSKRDQEHRRCRIAGCGCRVFVDAPDVCQPDCDCIGCEVRAVRARHKARRAA